MCIRDYNSDMTSPGLRERKKQATRAALAEAAWLLAAEHGVSAVTVDDIARKADVSPRTFFNYFSSKEEAVLDRSKEFGYELARKLRERPADEPLDAALCAAAKVVLDKLAQLPDGWLSKLRKMRESSPELVPHQMAVYESISASIAEVIAERTGTDVARDMYPTLVTGWVLVAWRTAFEHWERRDPTTDVLARMQAALRQLSAGIDTPLRG